MSEPGAFVPIGHSLFRVVREDGQVVTCGATSASGNLNFSVDKGIYSVEVFALINNSLTQIIAMNNVNDQSIHFIDTSFTVTGGETELVLPDLLAPAIDTLEGGAFNILKQIYDADVYLSSLVEQCNEAHCQDLPLPRTQFFWEVGQASYNSNGDSILSSFTTIEDDDANKPLRVMILGGKDGDTANSDTDHYDNTVIKGVYLRGRFKALGIISSSSGGPQFGESVAGHSSWGMGLSFWLSIHLSPSLKYIDTIGSFEGETSIYYIEEFDLGFYPRDTPDHREVATLGEGNFYSGLIIAFLIDLSLSADNGQANRDEGARDILSKLLIDYSTTNNNHFKSVGPAVEILREKLSLVNGEKVMEQASNNFISSGKHIYGEALRPGTCTLSLVPSQSAQDLYNSDRFSDHKFFSVWHPGGPININLQATQQDTDNPIDLDLYLYREGFFVASNRYMAGLSATDLVEASMSSSSEIIDLDSLDSGFYMIDVYAKPNLSYVTGVDYSIKINNVGVCP